MPSSPTDRSTVLLTALIETYDHALEALLRDDLDRVAHLLRAADADAAELAATDPEAVTPGDRELHARASASHACLSAALERLQEGTRDELRKIRDGQRALRSYGSALR